MHEGSKDTRRQKHADNHRHTQKGFRHITRTLIFHRNHTKKNELKITNQKAHTSFINYTMILLHFSVYIYTLYLDHVLFMIVV